MIRFADTATEEVTDEAAAPFVVPQNIVEMDRLGDEIAELAAHIHAATYRLLTLLVEFEAGDGWGGGGFRSCAHWLSWRTGIALGAYAINPANDERIPIYIADYVLASYGTGAIMAVPAEDQHQHRGDEQVQAATASLKGSISPER